MPQVKVFQCPSCGANLSYDGGPEISFNCQFCGTSIIVPEELRPEAAERQSSAAAAATPVVLINPMGAELPRDLQSELKELLELTGMANQAGGSPLGDQAARLAEVLRLARSGQKLEAVALFRQAFPSISFADAERAVNAMGGGVSAPPMAAAPSQARPRNRAASCTTAGCGSLLALIIAGIVAGIMGFAFLPMRFSGSYQQALDAARANPAVIAALGAPVEASGWPKNGFVSCQNNTCTARYIIPLQGSQKNGRIDVMSNATGGSVILVDEGVWTLDAVVVVENGPTIPLNASTQAANGAAGQIAEASDATSTLSALQIDATAGAKTKITQQAQATKAAGATATQAARKEATVTAAAQATAQAVEAVTATAEAHATAQVISTTQAAWPRLVSDNFADNGLGWPTGPANDSNISVNVSVKGKKYTWAVTPKGSAYASAFPADTTSIADFSATVKVKFVQGGQDGNTAFGLMFRHSEPDYGFFGIDPTGQFRVQFDYSGGPNENITESSSAILTQTAQVNQLTVQTVGSDLVFLINNRVVYQIAEDLPEGDVGVGVLTQDKGKLAQVEFTNFEVRAPKQ